jgi:L-alanine-DL-glutamate epimerase-like enolase superfamily enzyme
MSAAAAPLWAAGKQPGEVGAVQEYDLPLLDLHKKVPQPVKIAKIELMRSGNNFYLRTESADGAWGLVRTKEVEDYIPLLFNKVAPYFLNKDARDLETLLDTVHIKNYKIVGIPFWSCVAFVEQSLFDLLGKTAGKPAGELLGGVVRKEIPVYLSGSGRETTAEEEVDVYVRGVQATGARAVKFKIGGRMSRNADTYPGRTEKMLELARKRLGDGITLYADANGSYDSKKGIEVGKLLESLKFAFYEEPCPFEETGETKRVADALQIPIAFGECDTSLWKFHHMIETRALDILQPDLNYNGGFIRCLKVARMARKRGLPITPHNTQTGASAVNIAAFASAVPNTGPFMEYPWRAPVKRDPSYSPNFEIIDGKIKVPAGPGLGLEYDPAWLKKLERVNFS